MRDVKSYKPVIKNVKLKDFDLKAGDLVFGKQKIGGQSDKTKKWRVIAVYPHIFVCQMLGGKYNLVQAFDKVAYQIGEVTRT